jgi:hypothetical protein
VLPQCPALSRLYLEQSDQSWRRISDSKL